MREAVVGRYRELMLAPGVRAAMLARLEQLGLIDPATLLRRVRAPVLLLWGERDGLIPVEAAQHFLRELPDARLAVLRGLGNVPQEEAPEAALGLVREFLPGGQEVRSAL